MMFFYIIIIEMNIIFLLSFKMHTAAMHRDLCASVDKSLRITYLVSYATSNDNSFLSGIFYFIGKLIFIQC